MGRLAPQGEDRGKGKRPWPDGHIRPGGALPEARALETISPPWRDGADGECAVHEGGPSSDGP
eukprot:3144719-Pyramimonas_sp.AAC.1